MEAWDKVYPIGRQNRALHNQQQAVENQNPYVKTYNGSNCPFLEVFSIQPSLRRKGNLMDDHTNGLTIKKEGPVTRPLNILYLIFIGLGLLFQCSDPFLDPCLSFLTPFGIGFFNRRDLVLEKGVHRPVKGSVGQVIGVVALPEVHLTGQ